MKQVDVVINVIKSFTSENNINFELSGSKVEFSDNQKNAMTDLLFASYQAGDLSISSEKAAAAPKTYLKSMLNNHMRKDKRLNGNVDYKDIKGEGTTRVTDPQLKELKKLYAAVCLGNDAEVQEAVKIELDLRQSEVDAKKTKITAIDVNHIPESLRHLCPTA